MVSVALEKREEGERFVLRDRGPGMGRSPQKGAGLGLAIVELMSQGMGLHFSVTSTEDGTCCVLARNRDAEQGQVREG